MNQKTGRLIVIEGIDGSGKTVQTELLKQALASRGTPLRSEPSGLRLRGRSDSRRSKTCEAISFPRYTSIYGQLICRYLTGEFGRKVNPYLIALAYAGDRLLAKPLIENWLKTGRLVLANRYISASYAHLGANLPVEERKTFINWLNELEYNTNRMPKADLTILLTVDPRLGQKNVLAKAQPDIHEQNLKHLEEAQKIYLDLARQEPSWQVIDCMLGQKMKTPLQIHQEILAALAVVI